MGGAYLFVSAITYSGCAKTKVPKGDLHQIHAEAAILKTSRRDSFKAHLYTKLAYTLFGARNCKETCCS